ncbi:hypothetical protein [Rosistilla ulvae]|nr:hypothetical protein [Rosistilla ulvae]
MNWLPETTRAWSDLMRETHAGDAAASDELLGIIGQYSNKTVAHHPMPPNLRAQLSDSDLV